MIDQPVNYDDALEYVRKEFDRFEHVIVNRNTIRALYMHKVLTHAEKLHIQDLKVQDRMEYLLDYIIIPSLAARSSQKFIAFINILKKSTDTTMNRVASDMIDRLF